MTLREESGNGPSAGPETGDQPGELPAQQQEPPGQPQEPAAQLQESPAHLREAVPSVPPPREAPSPLKVPAPRDAPPPLEVPAPREAPSPLEVPAPREAPSPVEVPTLREAPLPLAAAAPPQEPAAPPQGPASPLQESASPLQESAAMPGTPGGLIARAEPDTGTGPASPGGSPPRRRRSLAAILIVGFAVICLIGLGAFATVLLLHGRTHARPPALPSVFQLRMGDCVNSGRDGISSPTVVPCGQPHDAEIYARFALAGHGWPGKAAIGAQARRGCTARLGSYLNPQLATTVLAESYVFPDQGAWNAGERTVICEIRSTTGKLTGSVRGLS
jgi:Septum formation